MHNQSRISQHLVYKREPYLQLSHIRSKLTMKILACVLLFCGIQSVFPKLVEYQLSNDLKVFTNNQRLTFQEAYDFCNNHKLILLRPTKDFPKIAAVRMKENLKITQVLWLAAHRTYSIEFDNDQTGNQLAYDNYAPGQPKNGKQFCLVDGNTRLNLNNWYLEDCNEKHVFFCQEKPKGLRVG